jgi:HTH-type transcriptional regulator / antitoxin HigA
VKLSKIAGQEVPSSLFAMNTTFDTNTYANLLTQYQPKVITSESENSAAISFVEKLVHQSSKSLEEETLLNLLVTLIEKFEDEHYPIPVSSPLEVLKHLMEAGDFKQEDLVGIIGSRGVVSEVVNGKRSISKAQAIALGKFFNVDTGLFIG